MYTTKRSARFFPSLTTNPDRLGINPIGDGSPVRLGAGARVELAKPGKDQSLWFNVERSLWAWMPNDEVTRSA